MPTPFSAPDFLGLDALLTPEEVEIRSQVRAFVTDRVIPGAGARYEEGSFPEELIAPMGELGLYGPTLPERYGCAGVSAVAYGLICQELERGDSGLRSFASVQGSLVMWPIHAFGSDEQKDEWLPRLATGEAIGCFGLTEPDAGSDPGAMKTRAARDGDDWLITGRKMWITNGSVADVGIVWARTDDGIRGFVVDTTLPGLDAPEQKHKWSLRSSVTSELVLDGVRVPDSARLPGAEGLRAPLSCLTQARYGIAWGVLGAAMACYDEALSYAGERIVFERPLSSFQIPQTKIAQMLTDITLGQLIALRLGRLKDEGAMTPDMVSMAKRNNVEKALEIARTCRDMLGANGISLEYQVGRHLMNLETVKTYEGTHDIHTLALGAAATGQSAFR